jgi:hypothetical protein
MSTQEKDTRQEEPTDPREPVAGDRFQFRLSHLFMATFLVAVIVFLAQSTGVGSLPLSIGLALVCLNAQGFFGFWQHKRSRPRLFYVVWLLIAVSLFLPSAKGCNNQTIHGWQAAQMMFVAEVEMLHEVTTKQAFPGGGLIPLVLLLSINLANLLILLSPLLLFRLQKGKGRLMGNALAISAVSVWVITWDNASGFLIGYYVWAGGITLLIQTWRIGCRVFFAMVILAVVIVIAGTYL